ncbi:Serine/threonine-protein kinase pkn1 [Lacunisphaera limnophila]|uniref:Serine/threonine-protein kinase pkn1 n=1 Tax=Lacunisphaera limnophila TaxID=1838286 RepID=A0A1D8AWL3_9BACT|nr:SUMF1/EgtB/PvdO family nonheme iron enzyme [Lacunisphaera limnophila]AOS45275.1 Serine/threonine-protein kinase pkn1 [Lacunisphaera limnophila]
MTIAEAARILEVSIDSTPVQIEVRFQQLRTALEDRIAKAPTPGLKAKYRESLDEITAAFEILTLAADTSALPVLKKESGGKLEAGGPAAKGAAWAGAAAIPTGGSGSQSHAPSHSSARKSSGREFLIVVVIAVIVLGAGGWWVMKTRAENVEMTRMAAEARDAAEARVAAEKRQAEEVRLVAEAQRKTEAEEKARATAAAQTEQERVGKLQVSLQAELAEIRTLWEIFERTERDAEKAASEAKSDLRSLRDAPVGRLRQAELRAESTADYARWLADRLMRHPARTIRARAEQLVSAKAVDEALPLVEAIKRELAKLDDELRSEQERQLTLTGSLQLASNPTGLAWSLVDAFGRSHTGITPARVTDLGLGLARVTFRRSGWPEQTLTAEITRGREAGLTVAFESGSLRLESEPASAEVLSDGLLLGKTPLVLNEVRTGILELNLRLKGYVTKTIRGEVHSGERLLLKEVLARVPRPVEGQAFVIPGLELTILPVAAGTYLMGAAKGGSEDERPVTRVTISRPFWLGRTEVTQAQWRAIMGSNPSFFKGDDLPVEQISWDEAMEFCRKLTDREQAADRLPDGFAYTLPMEAQWEYAGRAGMTGGDMGNLNEIAWYSANTTQTQSAGQKRANAWGFCDMLGNVMEWTWGEPYAYPGGSVTDPMGNPSGTIRVTRGATWRADPVNCRYSLRFPLPRDYRGSGIGFRIALSSIQR